LKKQEGILKASKRFFKSLDGVDYTAAFKNLSTKKNMKGDSIFNTLAVWPVA